MLVMVLRFLLVVVSAQFLGHCRLFRGLSFGVLILALQANDGVHLGVDNQGVVVMLVGFWDGRVSSRPCELLPDGDLLLLVEKMLHCRVLSTVRISKVKGHADEAMVRAVLLVIWIGWGIMGLMRLLILVVGEFRGGSLMLGGIFLEFAPGGVLLFFPCIVSLLLSLVLLLIMMVELVLLLILWSGLLVVLQRSVGLRCGIGPFLPGPA